MLELKLTINSYNLATIPTPTIKTPDEILIKIHAAAINPVDVKMAAGFGKFLLGKDAS